MNQPMVAGDLQRVGDLSRDQCGSGGLKRTIVG